MKRKEVVSPVCEGVILREAVFEHQAIVKDAPVGSAYTEHSGG
jgi:hypothetical protein